MRSEVLYVRGVSEYTKTTLEKIARTKGISTNELVNKILADYVKAPELRNLDNKYIELTDKMIALYKAQADRLAETLAEQSELIRELLDRQDI
ncbi:hypothetical protein QU661_03670 [Mogibacterium neglectum]|uniref:hypothetical protein n=1 Tax=Mogibacterium neglectum TaxID=114528 RepID=UPI00272C7E75|nr:hypothetical protein [Mogibacterium neglectum]WLD76942.1 hypothetical protein QU661_03670 [Mogibacterium neglectum]